MRRALGMSLLSVAVVGACSTSSPLSSTTPPPAKAARTVSMGPGLSATLTKTGQLTITQSGKTVVATTSKTPLFSDATDTSNPKGFHNPEKLSGVAFDEIPDSAVTIDSPTDGVLHLTATSARNDTVLVSLALASDTGFYTGLGERYDHVDPRGQIIGMQLEIQLANESGTTDRHG